MMVSVGVPKTWMLVVASRVSSYARAARSRTTPIWNSNESVSGWTCTTPTSVPSSLAYSLNARRRGSFASMKSLSPGTRFLSASSLPSFNRLVAMKMNGPVISSLLVIDEVTPESSAGLADRVGCCRRLGVGHASVVADKVGADEARVWDRDEHTDQQHDQSNKPDG